MPDYRTRPLVAVTWLPSTEPPRSRCAEEYQVAGTLIHNGDATVIVAGLIETVTNADGVPIVRPVAEYHIQRDHITSFSFLTITASTTSSLGNDTTYEQEVQQRLKEYSDPPSPSRPVREEAESPSDVLDHPHGYPANERRLTVGPFHPTPIGAGQFDIPAPIQGITQRWLAKPYVADIRYTGADIRPMLQGDHWRHARLYLYFCVRYHVDPDAIA